MEDKAKYQVGGSHYQDMSIQPFDVIDTWPLEQQIGFLRGNALKYLMRMGSKGSAKEDAQKALHYCQLLAQKL